MVPIAPAAARQKRSTAGVSRQRADDRVERRLPGSGMAHSIEPQGSEEKAWEPADPHPDVPDDFDEDAEAPRESEEAVREEPRSEDESGG